MAANYGELKAEIKDYLYGRKDLDTRIPGWIDLAERRIFRQLRCRANEKIFNGVINTDTPDGFGFTLPDDFIEFKYLTVNTKPLQRISEIEYFSKFGVDEAGGEPTLYARVINEIKFWRAADSDYAFQYVYWYDQTGDMSADIDSTPVLLFAPDLYLYGALIEGMPFLVKDERLATWQNMFSQRIDEINFQTSESEYAGSNVSVGSPYSDPIRGVQSGRRL